MKLTKNLELRVNKETYDKYGYKGFHMQQWYPVIGYDNSESGLYLIIIDDSEKIRLISADNAEVREDL